MSPRLEIGGRWIGGMVRSGVRTGRMVGRDGEMIGIGGMGMAA